jgi:hypothetical protein
MVRVVRYLVVRMRLAGMACLHPLGLDYLDFLQGYKRMRSARNLFHDTKGTSP